MKPTSFIGLLIAVSILAASVSFTPSAALIRWETLVADEHIIAIRRRVVFPISGTATVEYEHVSDGSGYPECNRRDAVSFEARGSRPLRFQHDCDLDPGATLVRVCYIAEVLGVPLTPTCREAVFEVAER